MIYEAAATTLWKRTVIETGLNQAHALGWADFDGDGDDELVVGWRNKPWGIAMYKQSAAGEWTKTAIDDGVAVEDLTIADLNKGWQARPDCGRPGYGKSTRVLERGCGKVTSGVSRPVSGSK